MYATTICVQEVNPGNPGNKYFVCIHRNVATEFDMPLIIFCPRGSFPQG